MNEKNNNVKPNSRKNLLWAILLIGMIFLLFYFFTGNSGTVLSAEQFKQDLNNSKIEKVVIKTDKIEIFYNSDSITTGSSIKKYIGVSGMEEVVDLIDMYNATHTSQVDKIYSINSSFNWDMVVYIIVMLGSSFLIILLMTRMLGKSQSSSFDFVKNRARLSDSKIKFDNVAGAEEEKQELKEIVDFLKNPKKFTEMGARIPKGVLLIGQPGTGKTLFAKAVAGEADVPFFTISGSDFMELFVGVGASRVRDLFNEAKKAKPCIVFIDEIDAIGRQRGTGLGGGNDEREQTLNQLLVQMDGFETNEGVIIMAATNRVDILDPALLRPGRFDRQIYIQLPDVKGREEILKVHSKNKTIGKDVNFKQIARITAGFTGAELENLLNEAAILATRENSDAISMVNITEGIDKVTMGPQKRSRVVTEKDKLITAYHESGHAIIGKLVKNAEPIHEVSIVPRGMAAGYTVSRPDNDDVHVTKSKLMDMIVMLLGGRTSEKLFLDDITAGASNDLQRATELAKKMVVEFGMSEELGLMHLSSENSYFFGKDYVERTTYSENSAMLIDKEIKKILDKCQLQAEKLLSANKKKVKNMVDVLIAKETIYAEEVDMILDGKSTKDVIDYIDSQYAVKNQKKIEAEKKKQEELKLKTNIIKNNNADVNKVLSEVVKVNKTDSEVDSKNIITIDENEEIQSQNPKSDKNNIEVLPADTISDSLDNALKSKDKDNKKK